MPVPGSTEMKDLAMIGTDNENPEVTKRTLTSMAHLFPHTHTQTNHGAPAVRYTETETKGRARKCQVPVSVLPITASNDEGIERQQEE